MTHLPEALEPIKDSLKINEPLANYSYMKVGGPADYLAITTTNEQLIDLVQRAHRSALRYMILGGGSNTIFSDAGYRGLIIINRTSHLDIDRSTSRVTVDAGVATNALVNQTISQGFAGLETFLGVPGSVGGAVYNNSHYLNELIGDHVSRVKLLKKTGEWYWESQAGMNFRYDYSKLHHTHEDILEVEFQLQPGDAPQLTEIARAALTRRQQTQPLSMPSSGCMFQNFKDEAMQHDQIPVGITSAGALIDQAGLKGLRVGGAEISAVHANFIVNTGNATTADIIELSNQIISTIKSKYGFTLKREVFILNEFGERMHL